VFQFRKNEYKKTCNILKNDFTKFILKNTKKIYYFKAEANAPNDGPLIHVKQGIFFSTHTFNLLPLHILKYPYSTLILL
jgi:hypothetical protein